MDSKKTLPHMSAHDIRVRSGQSAFLCRKCLEMDPVAYFLSWFPNTPAALVASDRNDKLQVNVISSPDRNSFVCSELEAGEYYPKVVSTYPHIPYRLELANQRPPASAEQGVFVFVIEVHDTASKLRVRYQETIQELNIVSGKACLFVWDTPWLSQSDSPEILQLFLDGHWEDAVHPGIAATPATFIQKYIEYIQTRNPELDWTWDGNWQSFKTPKDRARTRAVIQMFVDRFEGTEPHMSSLAAGAVEDSLSHEFLDYIEADSNNRQKWQNLLRAAYFHNEPADLQERIRHFIEN